jgi:hypothetical protein
MATFIQKTNSISKDLIENIKYEDFVTNYPDSLSDTLEFLGIPYAPELEKFEMKQTSIGRWRNELTPKQITFCKDKFGAMFEILEYQITKFRLLHTNLAKASPVRYLPAAERQMGGGDDRGSLIEVR